MNFRNAIFVSFIVCCSLKASVKQYLTTIVAPVSETRSNEIYDEKGSISGDTHTIITNELTWIGTTSKARELKIFAAQDPLIMTLDGVSITGKITTDANLITITNGSNIRELVIKCPKTLGSPKYPKNPILFLDSTCVIQKFNSSDNPHLLVFKNGKPLAPEHVAAATKTTIGHSAKP